MVRGITAFHDLQPNKQMAYWKTIRDLGLWGNRKVDKKDLIIADEKLYVIRNMKSKLFHAQYGYFSEEEKQNAEQMEEIYNTCRNNGIEVIECIYV